MPKSTKSKAKQWREARETALHKPHVLLPSLYNRVPGPDPAPKFKQEALVSLLENGATASILTEILGDEAEHVLRTYKLREGNKPKLSKNALVRRKRKTEEDATSDEEEDETGEEEVVPKKRGRRRGEYYLRMWPALGELPTIEVPEMDLPPDLPPGDLLALIHSHTSHLLSSPAHQFLLPPLSPDQHYMLPSFIQSKIDDLQAGVNQVEESMLQDSTKGSEKRWKEWKRGRFGQGQAGVRTDPIWTNVERAWEASSLVALGTLMQLLAEDMVNYPEGAPESEDEALEEEDRETRERRRQAKGKGRAVSPSGSVVEDSEAEQTDLEVILRGHLGGGEAGEVGEVGEVGEEESVDDENGDQHENEDEQEQEKVSAKMTTATFVPGGDGRTRGKGQAQRMGERRRGPSAEGD